MFEEGRYSAEELRRNRLAVGVLVVAGMAACLIGAAVSDWPWPNAIGMCGVVAAFGAAFWWLFASRKAGPLSVNAGSWNRFRRTWFMKSD